MHWFEMSLPAPEENLACDEALLDQCERGAAANSLRFWEPSTHFVVVGYANPAAKEVNLRFCEEHHLPVLRRCSGGGAVLQGPGCLNYSLILRLDQAGPLRGISGTNDFVMQRHRLALSSLLGAPVKQQGHTDLTLGGLKFSGNAQRRRQCALLFHGCFLLNLDLRLVEKALPLPSKAPAYRARRAHTEFLMNLNIPSAAIKAALARAWEAEETRSEAPSEAVARLVREKYSQAGWNFRF
jgi:lipoate---protein ligase